MKITFFTANMEGGGAERVMSHLINAISNENKDYKIDLILSNKVGIFLKGISPKINIIDFNKKHVRNSLFPLIKYFKNEEPDYFISSLDYVNIIASLAHKLSKSKSRIFFWEHNTLSIHSKNTINSIPFINKILIRYFYKESDIIITVSKQIKNDLVEYYNIKRDKITVIYNPAYSDSIIELSNSIIEGSIHTDNPYIVTVGRLTIQKNHVNLLHAFKNVLDILNDDNLKLIIVGEGPDRFKIESEIKKLKLDRKVYLTGFLNNPFPIIKNAKLFILSSDWEGLPTILIEALALKKQIVSTDCPSGPREILDNGKYGLLVETNNSKELSNAIISLLNGKIKFSTKTLLERAKYFNINNSLKQFMRLINN